MLARLVLPATPASTDGAGTVVATVKDDRGRPVADAVVSLTPSGGTPPSPRAGSAIMDQQDKEFIPVVLPVVVGTSVTFPNRDNIRHHVYSFSPARRFELPLYSGTPASPVTFDKPGVVVLGCNIHDWMVGYIYVLPTPFYAKTGDDGQGRIGDVPAGAWEARLWHPRLRGEAARTATTTTVVAGETAPLAFAVDLKPDRRPVRRPGYDGAQGN
jgi:plastocyanin